MWSRLMDALLLVVGALGLTLLAGYGLAVLAVWWLSR